MEKSLRISWNDELNTGERSIDLQHKYLVQSVDELGAAIEGGNAKMVIGEILVVMQYYTEWHFEQEEKCMHEYQCPIAETNKKAHTHFIELFEKYRKEYREQGATNELARRIYNDLTDWLVSHILKVDKQIGTCLH